MSNYVDEIVGGDGIRRYDVYGDDGTLIHPRVELRKNYVAAQEGSPWGAAEANAKLDASIYTAQDVLNKIKTVDGAGSGLDADLLDGRNAANAANSIPILNASGKLPIAQVPTGATASTVSLGNHGHNYLPLSGGTVSGNTNFTGRLMKDGYDVITSQTNVTMESGTWTPTPISGISIANLLQSAYYCRVGKIVWATCTWLEFSATGNFEIGGLPFPTKTGYGLAQRGWGWNEISRVLDLYGHLSVEMNKIRFFGNGSGNITFPASQIGFSCIYAME